MKLGSQGLEVSAQGLGSMGMSAVYGPPKPEEEMIELIHHAIDSGVTFLDTSDVYGDNEFLLRKMGELKKLVEEGNTDTSVCLSCVHQRSVGLMQFTQLWQYSWNGPYGQGSGGRNSPYLQSLPRFQPENVEHNKTMFERVNEMAEKKGCAPGQLALAWVHHQGNDVCPIPSTINQNVGALSVKLMPEEMAELEAIADAVKGGRDGGVVSTWKNSETPPL